MIVPESGSSLLERAIENNPFGSWQTDWSGIQCRFNVEFTEERKSAAETEPKTEDQTGELLFTLDTETAEVTFESPAFRHQDRDANILLS